MNCAEAGQHLSNFLADAANAADVDALEAHLRDCEACRGTAVELFYQDRLLIEQLASVRLQKLAKRIHGRLRRPAPRPRRRWVILLTMAASIVIVGSLLLGRFHRKTTTSATVSETEGEVLVAGAASPKSSEVLAPGQELRTKGAKSRAVVQFTDTTRLVVGGDSSLQWLAPDSKSADDSKQLLLQQGTVVAEVAPQPSDRAMKFSTPHAEVTVLGTRFQLSTNEHSTHLEVKEGSVRFLNKANRQVIEVHAGAQATAAPNVDLRAIRPAFGGSFGPGVRGVFFPPQATHALVLKQGDPRNGAELVEMGSRTSIKLATPASHLVRAAALSVDGKALATAGMDKAIHLWNPVDGGHQGELPGRQDGVRGLVFSPDGKTLAALEDGGTIRFWDFTEKKELGALPQVSVATAGVPAFSPDGRTLAVPNPNARETLRLFDVATRQPTSSIPDFDPVTRRVRRAVCAAFSPDGNTLAVGFMDLGSSTDGTNVVREEVRRGVELIDQSSGKKRVLFETPNEVWSVAFSADGTMLAAACNNLFNLWHVQSGQMLAEFSNDGTYTRAAFAGDGSRIAGLNSSRTMVDFWDLLKP